MKYVIQKKSGYRDTKEMEKKKSFQISMTYLRLLDKPTISLGVRGKHFVVALISSCKRFIVSSVKRSCIRGMSIRELQTLLVRRDDSLLDACLEGD